jgi:DNA-binding transcriptional LysR family regulator
VHVDVAPNDSIWRFEGPKGQVVVKLRGAFFSNAALTLRKAAVAGLGVTMVPRYAVADDLASGALVAVLPRYRVAPRPLLAVYPQAPVTPPKVQGFVDFLKGWMAEQDFGNRRPGTRAVAQ